MRKVQLALGLVLFAVGIAALGFGAWRYLSEDSGEAAQVEAVDALPYTPIDEAFGLPAAIPYYNYDLATAAAPTPTPPPSSPTVRMIIESIDVDAPVITLGLEGNGIPQVPLNGEDVAWYDFSSRPGEGRNAVFAGHYTWSKAGAVFWRLNEVKEGDTIRLVSLEGREFVYRVFASFGVDPDDPESLKVMAPSDRDIVTLITCGGRWLPNPSEPFGGDYSERTIVQAKLVQPA